MAIIFVLLGLGFLGGGIALIVEGWPYMILERGFTQVIAGTVLASAGVVLLALSRVLSELRRVRSTLANAVMAASLASMATREEPALSEAFALEPAQRRDVEPAHATGALAGVAAGALTGAALTRDEPGRDAVENETVEQDLFGVVPPSTEEPTISADEPAALQPVEDDSARLPFGDEAWLDRELARGIADQQQSDAEPPAAIVPTDPAETEDSKENAQEDDAFARDLEHALALDPPPDDPAPAEPVKSEFDFLRERLAHLRAEPDETPQLRPVADGEIHDAAAWMAPLHGEPSDDAAERVSPGDEAGRLDDRSDEPMPLSLEPLAWPPLTHSASPDPAASMSDVPLVEPARPEDAFAATQASTDPADPPETEVKLPDPLDDAIGEDMIAEAEHAAPAASNEGVVGAYQVGDAHFTIYADGSIQARTPDGDYRFGSMDELKTYLASEKSRLGV